MTNKEAIEAIQEIVIAEKGSYVQPTLTDKLWLDAMEAAIEALEATEWIPITYRDADEDEQEDGVIYMLTCPLPEENEAVFISVGHHVHIDTMCYGNGWYFDNYGDIRDVDAWMPLPKPYRSEGCR